MPVTVSPIQTINVRVNPQNQQVVQSSSQFVGASGALAQEALNLANTALAQSNVAIALAEEAVANVHGDRLISTSNGQAILDSSNNFTVPGSILFTPVGNSAISTGSTTIVVQANTLNDTTGLYLEDGGIAVVYANGQILLQAGDTQQYPPSWFFNTDGTISFPDNTLQGTAFSSDYISEINNTANVANYASNKANNALANTSGTFGGNLTISGNLAVLGTTTSVNTEIVNQQEIVAGKLTANANISSTSTNTGSLIVLGGVGVSGNVFANGISLTTNNFTANAITIDGGGF